MWALARVINRNVNTKIKIHFGCDLLSVVYNNETCKQRSQHKQANIIQMQMINSNVVPFDRLLGAIAICKQWNMIQKNKTNERNDTPPRAKFQMNGSQQQTIVLTICTFSFRLEILISRVFVTGTPSTY